MNSLAAVTQAPGRITVEQFPVADPAPGAVIMKVRLAGICGTDKHTFRGESKQYAGTPHERDIEYPLINGHENVGTVVACGGEVRDSSGRVLQPGDRIVPGANVPCGHCYYCMNGYPYYLCQDLQDYGNSLNCVRAPYLFGGWSQYMYLLPGTPIFRVPDDLPDEVAVITEVMAVTHGVEKGLDVLGLFGGEPVGFSVAVLGVGPLGMCHLAKARMLGAGTVIATDLFPNRLGIARDFGANVTLDVSSTDERQRLEAVRDATNGFGVDIALDCSGFPSTFLESLNMVRTGGVVVEAGTFVDMGSVQINPNSAICTRNVAVLGIGGEIATAYEPSMKLMLANLNRYPLAKLVSHRFPLAHAQEAVELAQLNETMVVAIDPNA